MVCNLRTTRRPFVVGLIFPSSIGFFFCDGLDFGCLMVLYLNFSRANTLFEDCRRLYVLRSLALKRFIFFGKRK